MKMPGPTAAVRRFGLPTACAVLAVASFVAGERVLVNNAGASTVGTLAADEASLLAAFIFAALAVTTLLIAIFPGRENPHSREPDAATLADALSGADDADRPSDSDTPSERRSEETPRKTDGATPVATPVATPAGKHRAAPVPGDEVAPEIEPVDEGMLATLQGAAVRHARERAAAESRAEKAEAQAAKLTETLAGLRNGSSPEAKALRAKLREEASREAMVRVRELSEAAERLTSALQQAKSNAETQLMQERAHAADTLLALDAAHRDEVVRVAHESASIEYERISAALNALNRTHLDILDPMQREAVGRHQERVVEALLALDPDARPGYLPTVEMPPVEWDTEAMPQRSDADGTDQHDQTGDEGSQESSPEPPPAPSRSSMFKRRR